MKPIHQNITKIRRDYNALVVNETLEDYALRYAPRSFRKWSEFQVANTAFGSTSFLVLEAIGGFLSINYGFTNAFWAIIAVGIVILSPRCRSAITPPSFISISIYSPAPPVSATSVRPLLR